MFPDGCVAEGPCYAGQMEQIGLGDPETPDPKLPQILFLCDLPGKVPVVGEAARRPLSPKLPGHQARRRSKVGLP